MYFGPNLEISSAISGELLLGHYQNRVNFIASGNGFAHNMWQNIMCSNGGTVRCRIYRPRWITLHVTYHISRKRCVMWQLSNFMWKKFQYLFPSAFWAILNISRCSSHHSCIWIAKACVATPCVHVYRFPITQANELFYADCNVISNRGWHGF